MNQMRVADWIANFLCERGVGTVFLLSGGGMMHLVDAVARTEGLACVYSHHEQACAIAADGYARRSGQLGACFGTSGPGATNILTGLAGAWQDSSPVLFVTGQSKVSQSIRGSGLNQLRQYGTFEVDTLAFTKSMTKYSVFLDDPQSVRYHFEKAAHIARLGRPGPVVIDIPLDVQGAPIDPGSLRGFEPSEIEFVENNSFGGIGLVAEALRESRRPLIMAGYGVRVAGAVDEFRRIVEKIGVPVVTTQLGKDVLGYDHPLFVGHPGVKGDRPANFAVQHADVILGLGCGFQAQTIGYEAELFAPDAQIFHVDIDPAVLARNECPKATLIEAGVDEFLVDLESSGILISEATLGPWQRQCHTWKSDYSVFKEPHVITQNGPSNLYEVAEVLSQQLVGDETVVTDAGSCFYVMGQGFRLKKSQRYVVSGSLGAMGFALPAALGIACADNAQNCICVTGDGSLQTNVHELAALSKHSNLNIKLFVICNEGYASIRKTQNEYFDGFLAGTSDESGVFIPPLEKLCDAYGLQYVPCPTREGLSGAIATALDRKGVIVVGISSQFNQEIIPSVGSVRLPDGTMRSGSLHEMKPLLP